VPPQPLPVTSSKAIVSLVLGVASLVMCGLFTGIPAIILGVQARRSVAQSAGREGGEGLALGGIVTGIVGTIMWLLLAALLIGLVVVGVRFEGDFDEYSYDAAAGWLQPARPDRL
jgi:hypothetical protein